MSCCKGHHRQEHHHGNHHRHRGSHHGDCQCGNHHSEGCSCGERRHHREDHFHRRYYTREENISRLERYLEDLQAEVQAVEERLEKLQHEA